MRWTLAIVLSVISPLLASAGVNVTVSTPANNSTVTSPVVVTASATSDKNITGWRIYVDGTSVYHAGSVTSIKTSVSMATGTHQVVIRAWASNGTFGSVILTETVGSSTPATAQGAITPTSLAFGSVATNTSSSSQAVKITNSGSATLNISGVSISPSQFAVSGATSTSIAPGSSASYTVTFSPTAVTAYAGTMSFSTNSATAVPAVTLSGTGVDQSGTNADCSGTTYYVSTSGNDSNSGISTSSPWKTIAHVVSFEPSLRAGDCVLFQRGGTWHEQLTISNLRGTQTNPITFGNYGSGNRPIIDGSSSIGSCIYANGGGSSTTSPFAYITVNGFECRNTTQYGIYFHNYATPGNQGSPGIVVKNSDIHNTGPGAYAGGSGAFDDGNYRNQLMFLDQTQSADGTQYLNNSVHDCGGHNCMELQMDTGSPLIQGNLCYGWVHMCIDVKDVVGAKIYKNTVHGPGQQGSAFFEDNEYLPGQSSVTWAENVVYNVPNGFECETHPNKPSNYTMLCRAYNNTYHGGGSGIVTGTDCSQALTWDVYNNVLDTPNPFYHPYSCTNRPINWDYNDVCATQSTCNTTGNYFYTPGPHDVFKVNPLYMNSAGTPPDFRLQSASPVLNIGNSSILGLTFMGACDTSGTCPLQ